MALQATDLFVFQREGVLSQCPIGELQDKMQDTDLIMLQRGGGPLSKTTWGDKDNFQDTDLFVVHNGTQMCQTTWADIAPNLAIVKEINLNKTETWDFSTQFTAEEWSGDKPKELYVRSSAVIYGQPGTPALTSGDTPFGGTLLVVIEGELYGGAGTANGGAGGTALKITNGVATVVNKNKMYGGGGGGGQGGKGGSGSYYVDSGCLSNEGCNKNTCYNNNDCSSGLICTGGQGMCWDSSEDMQACCNCCVSRTYYYPEGGNGGDGGQGQDYLNAAGTGSAGANGNNGSGSGGTGGDGGNWGEPGTAGQAGGNGNNGSGQAGSPGGTAGHYFEGTAGTSFTNEGEIKGITNI